MQPLPGRGRFCAFLILTTILCGCGSHLPASGDRPIETGRTTPNATVTVSQLPDTRNDPPPTTPGTAVLFRNRFSYTPARSSQPRQYLPMDPTHPAITVAPGTLVEVRLGDGLFMEAPSSSRTDILRPDGITHSQQSVTALFRAEAPGTSELTAKPPPCTSNARVACYAHYRVRVTVHS
jgi:hypothetical protein